MGHKGQRSTAIGRERVAPARVLGPWELVGLAAIMWVMTRRLDGETPGLVTRRGLRVGIIAPPWLPVPPVRYGGTENVIDILARGLVTAGVEVVLVTTGDATCPVPRRWV